MLLVKYIAGKTKLNLITTIIILPSLFKYSQSGDLSKLSDVRGTGQARLTHYTSDIGGPIAKG